MLNPEIVVAKTCTHTAQVGETITYTITVNNTGDEALDVVDRERHDVGDLWRVLHDRRSSPGCGANRTTSPTLVHGNSPTRSRTR